MEERRLILAFALSFAVLLGFRMWTDARYPKPPVDTAQKAADAGPNQTPAAIEAPNPTQPSATPVEAPSAPEQAPLVSGAERRVEITTPSAELAFSTTGARLLSWKLIEYRDERGRSIEAHPGGNPKPGPLDLVTGRPELDARLREAGFRAIESAGGDEPGATFEYSDGTLVVSKTIRSIKGGQAFRVEAEVSVGGVAIPTQVLWGPGLGQATENEKGLQGYLDPAVVEIDDGGSEIRLPATSLAEAKTTRVQLIGVENKYFAAIAIREKGTPFDATARAASDGTQAAVQILVSPPVTLIVGAKDYDRLKELDLGVERVVPVGSWIGPLVVPLTRALRAVNSKVGNYGIAIILLTIGIALAMAPLRHFAILSSAKMAKVGPQIRAVQERYKRLSLTDPKRQQMQREITEVYEKNGIDMFRQTATGCLPTLITMPFLFAFYRMLDISVDLKGAPFLWIPDLSLKDPLFITPLLSGLSMIGMQKLMPAPSMDPAQQRMLMLMPIIFSGMFAWAPAGLNLYWFVANLAAILQQALAMYFAPHLFPRPKAAN